MTPSRCNSSFPVCATFKFLAQDIEAIIISEQDYLYAGGTLYYVKWNRA